MVRPLPLWIQPARRRHDYNTMNAMIKKTAVSVLVALLLTLPLSGCLVEKKPIETHSRIQDNLRIYQPGDKLFYDFFTTRTIGNSGSIQRRSGTLSVKWESTADLQDPFDTTKNYSVLKQTFNISYNGETNTDPGIVRYIQQDATGAVSVVAVESGTELFWFDAGGGPTVDAVSPMVILGAMSDYLASTDSTAAFHLMGGCSGKTYCDTDNSIYNNSISYLGDSQSVTSDYLGKFTNPLKLIMDGSIQPLGGEVAPFLDILHACDDSPQTFVRNTGTVSYVFPEIGPIRIDNFCYFGNNDLDQTTYLIRSASWW